LFRGFKESVLFAVKKTWSKPIDNGTLLLRKTFKIPERFSNTSSLYSFEITLLLGGNLHKYCQKVQNYKHKLIFRQTYLF